MAVLKEIFQWSLERPIWQRDALRRLIMNDEISDEDILELTEICKSRFGLAEQQDFLPLSEESIPDEDIGSNPVFLESIFHYRGVNALAENQTLNFGKNITLVYGDNGAGKTGYIRLLKSACRARGQEAILGNVTSGKTPSTPDISIKYSVGHDSYINEWTGDGEDQLISRVSVFDTQSASVYLTEKTDVAFRPFGLDLFDKLVKICKAVRNNLELEKASLNESKLLSLQTTIPEGTAVSKLLSNINSLTKSEDIKKLAFVTPAEEARLTLLEKSLLDMKVNDPVKLIRELNLRHVRIQNLKTHLKKIETELSDQNVADILDIRVKGRRKSEEARKLRELTFPKDILPGTGLEAWTELWDAARHFSEKHAYLNESFPVVSENALCVLCQQKFESDAVVRMNQFQEFVVSTAERELREYRDSFTRMRKVFTDLNITNDVFDETIKEISIENEILAGHIKSSMQTNELRRQGIVQALLDNCDLSSDTPPIDSVSSLVEELIEEINLRITALNSEATSKNKISMELEIQELRARKLLAKAESLVIEEIERKKKIAAYLECIDETNTKTITQKSTSLTKKVVTQKLKESFKQELEILSFRHTEVELTEAGGTDGLFYHKLILTRAPGVKLPKVVSEGEQRCLSIAAFFAELSTADDPSGIVFDDPVSSLDYRWREGVARRLVLEAKKRQVIVFTHDVVFLLLLKQYCQELDVPQLDQHVRHLSMGSGVCSEDLPWVAMPVNKKVGYLKNELQKADKLFRDGHQTSYEKDAQYIYGLLREAWERALEEVLLLGIVERFRPNVQTQHITSIADITKQDCQILHTAMTKCSKWLPGHDQAAAARAVIPEPNELENDIHELEDWVRQIRKRRN